MPHGAEEMGMDDDVSFLMVGGEDDDSVIDIADGQVVDTDEVVDVTMSAADMHDANLAEHLSEDELEELGTSVCDAVDEDEESRSPWFKRFNAGLKNLGIYDVDKTNEVLDTVRVSHPLLIEAGTQFQARAMAELLPAQGPVKSGLLGRPSPELIEQGERIQMFMNYQLTVEDRGYYDERDQMLFKLPFTGSEFDKQYYCPIKKRVVSKWVKSENFVVPYKSTSLESAPRYTEIIDDMTFNEYKKLVKAGLYLDVLDAEDDAEEAIEGERDEVAETIDTIQGEEAPVSRKGGNRTLRLYEQHVDLDLPGFEDDDGIMLPYIVVVEAKSKKVLSIRRNWREADESRTKRVWYSHKKFLPGFGFYGFGLFHAIGGLGELATRLVDVLLDSGAFSSLQGGFKSKDAKLKGDIELNPGKWTDTELTADELAKAFFTPPFKEPSEVLFRLLGLVVEGGQRFAATTETMVGDAATTGPVGSMVAQIEQGSKVFSGVHKRLHKGFGDEFIHIAELNGEWLPEQYPYQMGGEEQMVLKSDFDGRVDIVPVSDPNIFSSAQRLAIAQTAMQVSAQYPGMANAREAAIDVLRAIRHPDPERIFPPPKEAPHADPITEGMLAMTGKAIKVFIEQDHAAHIMVHQMQMQSMPPQVQPAMQSHILEHMAFAMRLEIQQAMGMILPPVDIYNEEQVTQPLPPEIENQIAARAAQASQQIMQQRQAAEQAQQAGDQMAQMQQAVQQMQQENNQLKTALMQAQGNNDAQKELLKNQGKQLDLAKESLKNRGKVVDLAKEQTKEQKKGKGDGKPTD